LENRIVHGVGVGLVEVEAVNVVGRDGDVSESVGVGVVEVEAVAIVGRIYVRKVGSAGPEKVKHIVFLGWGTVDGNVGYVGVVGVAKYQFGKGSILNVLGGVVVLYGSSS